MGAEECLQCARRCLCMWPPRLQARAHSACMCLHAGFFVSLTLNSRLPDSKP